MANETGRRSGPHRSDIHSNGAADSNAFERIVDALADRVVRSNQVKASALCPAHDDTNPSLSITATEGQALVHCHAGCDTVDVLAAIGLTMADLYDTRRGADYHYDNGRVVHRKLDKTFPQSNADRPAELYRLAKVKAAVAAGRTVYVVEGEKDVHALETLRVTATTNPMGAGKWSKVDPSPLYGAAKVVIIPDRDKAGSRHASDVLISLKEHVKQIEVMQSRWGKDAADLVAAGLDLTDLEPVDAAVDHGAALLDELHEVLTDYVVFPSEMSSHAVTLWHAATHCLPAFEHATRLVIKSPEKRCGKSRLLLVIEQTAHDSLQTVNATVAAIFRFLALNEQHPPTLLLDEADSVFGTKIKAELNEDLRGLLNAGFERGKPTLRTVGPQHEPKKFPTFAMVALAGIGELPDTIEDRAVIINLARQAPNKRAKPYRSRRDGPRLRELHDRLAAWANTVVDQLADAYPDMPVEDRAADLWEPLEAVADMAGGHWPDRARTAALVMTRQSADADLERSLGVRLLADVRDVFDAMPTVSFLSSAELVRRLRDVDDGPWHELDLTTRRLAARLSGYRIRPGHNTAKTERGYQLAWFTDAFSRYLPEIGLDPSERPEPPETLGSAPDASGSTDASIRPPSPDLSVGTPQNHWPSDARTLLDSKCTACGYRLDEWLIARGETTHPSCGDQS